MNKQELVTKISTETEPKISKKDANTMIDTVLKAIVDGVNETGEVNLFGFGKFEKKLKKGREGIVQVGLSKGQAFKTADTYKITFAASKTSNDTVNE